LIIQFQIWSRTAVTKYIALRSVAPYLYLVMTRACPSRCGTQCPGAGAGPLWAVALWRHHAQSTV